MLMKNTLLLVLLASPFLGCPASDEYCLSCSADTCSSCAMTYLSGKVCTEPNSKITNCVTYQSASVCSSCDFGYKLSSDKKSCVAITIDNCLAVDDEKTTEFCMVCADGKKNDPATGKCTDTACSVSNCKYCTVASESGITMEACVWCNSGYSSSLVACVSEPTPNCHIAMGSTCASC